MTCKVCGREKSLKATSEECNGCLAWLMLVIKNWLHGGDYIATIPVYMRSAVEARNAGLR